jgi:hypothetical protein
MCASDHCFWRHDDRCGAAVLAGNYGGEQASIAANSSAGGNWLYGGSNNQIVLQATQIQDNRSAGYNLAYGIAEMSLSIGN